MIAAALGAFEEYRGWLELQSDYWRRQLKKGDSNPKRSASLNQIELPFELVEFFKVMNGQKSEKQFALPADGRQGLVLLDVEGCASSRSNSLGLGSLIKSLSYDVEFDCEPGIRKGLWRKQWFPIAKRDNGWGYTKLLMDNDPETGYPIGSLVVESFWLGKTTGRCLRTFAATSVNDYFCKLNQLAQERKLQYEEKAGVVADESALQMTGFHKGHNSIAFLEP